MKICPNCNTKNFDINTKCEKCDYPLDTSPFETVVFMPPQNASRDSKPTYDVKPVGPNSLQSVAKAFLIVSCVASAISLLATVIVWMICIFQQTQVLLPASWIGMASSLPLFALCIYMTNSYSHKIASGQKVGIGFKIITLLFISFIAGILMLCDNDN